MEMLQMQQDKMLEIVCLAAILLDWPATHIREATTSLREGCLDCSLATCFVSWAIEAISNAKSTGSIHSTGCPWHRFCRFQTQPLTTEAVREIREEFGALHSQEVAAILAAQEGLTRIR